jgi:hypothetical protein
MFSSQTKTSGVDLITVAPGPPMKPRRTADEGRLLGEPRLCIVPVDPQSGQRMVALRIDAAFDLPKARQLLGHLRHLPVEHRIQPRLRIGGQVCRGDRSSIYAAALLASPVAGAVLPVSTCVASCCRVSMHSPVDRST